MSLFRQLQEQLIKEYEPMTGSEYRTQMSKVKSKDKNVRKAVSHTLDKKKSKHTDHYKHHPDVKRARNYMKVPESVSIPDKDENKLKKIVKGLRKSVKGHDKQQKYLQKLLDKDAKNEEFKMKNCGCGKDPCETYGSKEDQLKEYGKINSKHSPLNKPTTINRQVKMSSKAPTPVNELSPDLVNKVAKQRRINTGRALAKHDDRRDPEYKKAVKKQQRNQDLNFRAGARKIDKFRKSLSKEGADLRPVGKSSDYAKYAAQDKTKYDRKKHAKAFSKGPAGRFSQKKTIKFEETNLAEYKTKKIKDSGEEREHIIMQLRNAIDLKGRSKIQFATGRPQQIPLEHIRAALHVHDNVIKKSADKLRYMKAIEKSPQHLKRMTQGVLKGTPAMKTAKLRQSPKKPQRLSKSGIYFNPNWDSDGR